MAQLGQSPHVRGELVTNKVQKLKKTEGIRNIRDEPLSEPSSGSSKKQNDTTNKTKLTFVGGGVKVSARI